MFEIKILSTHGRNQNNIRNDKSVCFIFSEAYPLMVFPKIHVSFNRLQDELEEIQSRQEAHASDLNRENTTRDLELEKMRENVFFCRLLKQFCYLFGIVSCLGLPIELRLPI